MTWVLTLDDNGRECIEVTQSGGAAGDSRVWVYPETAPAFGRAMMEQLLRWLMVAR